MSQPPSPDTRITTAPASLGLLKQVTPATARVSTVRHGHPAIRAHGMYALLRSTSLPRDNAFHARIAPPDFALWPLWSVCDADTDQSG
jgi:hypothetical protein